MSEKQLSDFFTPQQKDAILAAIRRAEQRTSGEIRVRLDRTAGDDVKGAARKIFNALGMVRTRLRNGVLFYLAVEDRKFCILGDDAIYHKAPPDFWDGLTREVLASFREGRYAEGLIVGIEKAGEHLARYFPSQDGDENELSDDLSIAGDGSASGIFKRSDLGL